jgi:hypothetical protein
MKKSTYLAMAIAALLAGCARGGGIGLEAMVADSTCEQRGFHLELRSMRTAVLR